jgi:hypothetical protein
VARAGVANYWEIPACTRVGQMTVNHGVVARGRGAEHVAFRKACRVAATAATAATAPALTTPTAAGSRRSNRKRS